MALLLLEKPYVMVGLGTNTLTIPAANTGLRDYNVHVESTEQVPSGVTLTVTNTTTSTLLYTAPVLSPTQGAFQFKAGFQASPGDVITVVLSGSGSDLQLNTVKSTITIGRGF